MMRDEVSAGQSWPALVQRGRSAALVNLGADPARVARTCSGIAYVAAPYSGEVVLRRDWRLERSVRLSTLAALETARLVRAGVVAVCPALMRAEMANVAGIDGAGLDPLDAELWGRQRRVLLAAADLVVVPALRGWDRCPDVLADVAEALARTTRVFLYAERVG